MNGNIQKGELITYNLTELIKPEAYEVRLTPITRFGEGDSTIRVIKYSGKKTFVYEQMRCGALCTIRSAVQGMVHWVALCEVITSPANNAARAECGHPGGGFWAELGRNKSFHLWEDSQ